jgi:type 1 glutamine amidotransferase
MKNFLSPTRLIACATALLLLVSAGQAQSAPKKILFFSKSSGFQHDMIAQKNGAPSKAEKILTELGAKNNLEFTFTKDGSCFTPENIAKYDAFFFYTTGDLTEPGTDKNPPMTQEGKAALLDAIAHGKGFIGTHSATDTFHSPGGKEIGGARYIDDGTNADPYIKMLGGEFIIHGSQQRVRQICTDRNFPGMEAVTEDFGPLEEWYSLKDFAPDLHVLLVQDTSMMDKSGNNRHGYDRPPYPSTWVHEYGPVCTLSAFSGHGAALLQRHGRTGRRGRVFYTSMGHRDDIWTNPVFQKVLLGGINWAVGNVNADVTPNIQKAAPGASVLPPG